MTTSGTAAGRRAGAFIATKEHRRFVEFASAVRREGHSFATPPPRPGRDVTLADLYQDGMLPPGTMLTATVNGVHLRAVTTFGGMVVEGGWPEYDHPSPAARIPSGAAGVNGWTAWKLPDGRSLDDLRKQYRREH